MLAKRVLDIAITLIALPVLTFFAALIAFGIKWEDGGPVFFRQARVGMNGKIFNLLKFRTMIVDAEARGAKVTSRDDPRITRIGHFLRKWKLDELPQLINVIRGEMSIVGPRPEVPQYVALWPEDDRNAVLSIRPGLTDFASINFVDEEVLLAQASDAQRYYTEQLIPRKLQLARKYVSERSMLVDLILILQTTKKILSGRN